MNKLFASIAGIVLMGAVGAGTAQAQGVQIKIGHGDHHVEIDTRKPAKPAPADNCDDGQYVTVKKKVWVDGCYTTVCEDVWVPASCRIVEEQVYVLASCKLIEEKVWVAATCKIIEERVYVAATTQIVKERRVDRHGCVVYVNVCKTVPAHYDTIQKHVDVPGHYECRTREVRVAAHYDTVQKRVEVAGHFEKREKQVYVAGHFDIVEERVFVKNNGHDHDHRETVSAPRSPRSTR